MTIIYKMREIEIQGPLRNVDTIQPLFGAAFKNGFKNGENLNQNVGVLSFSTGDKLLLFDNILIKLER